MTPQVPSYPAVEGLLHAGALPVTTRECRMRNFNGHVEAVVVPKDCTAAQQGPALEQTNLAALEPPPWRLL
jgi:hypothetical protein